MSRDHSIECPTCGESYGGMNAESEEHECDPASAEIPRLANVEASVTCLNCSRLSREVAGLQGENMGLRVSVGFFEQRCEVLEASTVRELDEREKDSMKGCCPLCALQGWEIVAGHISAFVDDYIKRWSDTSKDGPLIQDLAAAIREGVWRNQ